MRRAAHLDEELVVEILSWLPVQSLSRFRCMCKKWRALIDSSTFVKSHLSKKLYSGIYFFERPGFGSIGEAEIKLGFIEVDLVNCSDRLLPKSLTLPLVASPRPMRVIGSCDGLICLSRRLFTEILLVNPSTREYWLWPPISNQVKSCDVGLGYDYSADEYKVLLIPIEGSEVNIYGSKSNTWRQINVSPKYKLYKGYGDLVYGKYVRGTLHWVVDHPDHINPTMNLLRVVAFDLVSEKFSVAEYDRELFRNPSCVILEVLGGQLCLCCQHIVGEGEEGYMDIWVMKEYGVRESWSKLVTFDRFITPLAYSNCGRRLLFRMLDGWPSSTFHCSSLHWYDLDKKSIQCTNTWMVSDYDICQQSLIRLEQRLS